MPQAVAAPDFLTVPEAEALIGRTGDVVHPKKGLYPSGKYLVTGFNLREDDFSKVDTLQAESVARTEEVVRRNPATGVVVKRTPSHPRFVHPKLPHRWFKPDPA